MSSEEIEKLIIESFGGRGEEYADDVIGIRHKIDEWFLPSDDYLDALHGLERKGILKRHGNFYLP